MYEGGLHTRPSLAQLCPSSLLACVLFTGTARDPPLRIGRPSRNLRFLFYCPALIVVRPLPEKCEMAHIPSARHRSLPSSRGKGNAFQSAVSSDLHYPAPRLTRRRAGFAYPYVLRPEPPGGTERARLGPGGQYRLGGEERRDKNLTIRESRQPPIQVSYSQLSTLLRLRTQSLSTAHAR